ncbi:hypothetical protein GCM10022204_22540 [Microlunatus aurantiacus]|uniref:Uncharacterized protein n=1 Tax=Microlunatus aurantiacus TaxID=446786 RepID=A0ABP7DHR0_9ACTN
MEGWQLGLVAVVVVGLAVIVLGAVRDRRITERRRREILAPPERTIPRFSPDAATPRYLSELQARRPPVDAEPTDLSTAERDELQTALTGPDVTTIDSGYASADLVTDPTTGWSVLRQPNVLVAEAAVTTIRELLGVLERQIPTGRGLVVVAPAIADELLATFAVNHLQRVITILPVVVTAEADRERIADATGSQPASHADLQSGYVPPGLLGTCATWVSSARESHVVR